MPAPDHASPRRRAPALLALLVPLLLVVPGLALPGRASGAGAPSTAPVTRCALPRAGHDFTEAAPRDVQLDPALLARAVRFLGSRSRATVQVFRHNCLVAEGPLNPLFDQLPFPMFSVTKSVVSLLTGIAVGQGRLDLGDRIGRYLPHRPGWGDAAHRAITVRQLLTQSSGMDEAILSEAATTGLDPNLAREALAQPIQDEPGTRFRYSQLGPALLAYVVQRAVHRDLFTYARRRLFGPVGLSHSDYLWLRDRAGLVYGYSNLFLRPPAMARLGLLVQNRGRWRGRQVVPASYIAAVRRPSRTNGCYGLLFWTNAAAPCTGAGIPAAQTVHHRMVRSAPRDMFQMNGTGSQLNIMIPSLGITVTTTGLFGDHYPSPGILLGASPGDMQHEFFRLLMRAVLDEHVPDPGPYVGPPMPFDVDPFQFADPAVLLTDLFPGSGCSVLVCPD